MTLKTIDDKGRITLGKELAGTQVSVEESESGVHLRFVVAVPAEQAWFWSDRWQGMEREVDEHVRNGEVQTHESGEDFLKHLEGLGS